MAELLFKDSKKELKGELIPWLTKTIEKMDKWFFKNEAVRNKLGFHNEEFSILKKAFEYIKNSAVDLSEITISEDKNTMIAAINSLENPNFIKPKYKDEFKEFLKNVRFGPGVDISKDKLCKAIEREVPSDYFDKLKSIKTVIYINGLLSAKMWNHFDFEDYIKGMMPHATA